MLGAIIENEKEKTWSQLYIDKKENRLSLSGFTLHDGILLNFDKNDFSIFENFILGPNRKSAGKIDGYDAIVDETTGLYHFFKDGKEDFEKLFTYNGTPAIEPIDLRRSKKYRDMSPKPHDLRKFTFKNLKVVLLATMACLDIVLLSLCLTVVVDTINTQTFGIYYDGELIEVERNTFDDTITFAYEGIDRKIDSTITSNDIRDLIYSSQKLKIAEKDFLWNQDLIDLVVPYYNKNDNAKVLSFIRHTELNIKSFKGEDYPDLAGFFDGTGDLNIKDYDVEMIVDKGPQAKTLGHEYVHLLQMSNSYPFLKEALAEIMSHEFYMESCDLQLTYGEACRYTKVLMEIIGTDPVLDSVFCPFSQALRESISPYLKDDECKELCGILSLSPHYDKDKLNESGYERLRELLSIMYENKFGSPIEQDGLITCIMSNANYDRVYFNESLRNKVDEYYMTLKEDASVYSIEEAWLNGYVALIEERELSKAQYLLCKSDDTVYITYRLIDKVFRNDNLITDEGILKSPIFTLILDDGTQEDITLEEAESLGYVEVTYTLSKVISYDEYMNQKEGRKYRIGPQSGYRYDSINEYVYAEEDLIAAPIDSSPSKMQTNEPQIH